MVSRNHCLCLLNKQICRCRCQCVSSLEIGISWAQPRIQNSVLPISNFKQEMPRIKKELSVSEQTETFQRYSTIVPDKAGNNFSRLCKCWKEMTPCLLKVREVKGYCQDLWGATLSKCALRVHCQQQWTMTIRISCRAPRPWRAKACEQTAIHWILRNLKQDLIEVVATFKAARVIDTVIMLELMLQYSNPRYTAWECVSTNLHIAMDTYVQPCYSHLQPCSLETSASLSLGW